MRRSGGSIQSLARLLAAGVALFGAALWIATTDLTALGGLIFAAIVLGGGIVVWVKLDRAAGEAAQAAQQRLSELMHRSTHAKQNSIRDDTTGLLNRWYLERRLDEEGARCKRYGYQMSVVVVKAAIVNLSGMSLDGWQTESALAAHRCAQVVRNVDLSASLAPFEFALCLVHCDREGAQAVIRRVVDELSEYQCSIGVSVYPDDGCQPRALIELARVRLDYVASSQSGFAQAKEANAAKFADAAHVGFAKDVTTG